MDSPPLNKKLFSSTKSQNAFWSTSPAIDQSYYSNHLISALISSPKSSAASNLYRPDLPYSSNDAQQRAGRGMHGRGRNWFEQKFESLPTRPQLARDIQQDWAARQDNIMILCWNELFSNLPIKLVSQLNELYEFNLQEGWEECHCNRYYNVIVTSCSVVCVDTRGHVAG